MFTFIAREDQEPMILSSSHVAVVMDSISLDTGGSERETTTNNSELVTMIIGWILLQLQ